MNNKLSSHLSSKEFDKEKNFPLTPESFALGSNKKVWWKCEKGHSWEARINHRTKDVGCPYCAGNKPSKKNNLSLHLVSKEFDKEKNYPLTPQDFTLHSGKKIWWKCEKGHSWEARINKRVGNNRKCPFCAGQKPSKENNLSLHPVSKEFHPFKNGDKTPEDFTLGSGRVIWWLCDKKHEWKTNVVNRTRKEGSNCPKCVLAQIRSKGEIELYEWCKETFPAEKIEANNRKILNGLEIDIWFPELNKGIEFNGDYYHSFPEVVKKDKRKLQQASKQKINLLVVWENEWNNNKEKVKKKLYEELLKKDFNARIFGVSV